MTAEDWAPYAAPGAVLGADGWYSDYRTPPEHLRTESSTSPVTQEAPDYDTSLLGLVQNWRYVIADLLEHFHIDLYDAAVRARPWPGVRTAIFSLLDMPESRTRRALTRR